MNFRFLSLVYRTLKEQGLQPYHVQRVQALQPNDCICQQEFCEWAIQKCVDQAGCLRIVLFTDEAVLHATEFLIATIAIFSSTNPGQCSNFCKGSGQSTSTSKGRGVY
jgi:hypothetical protein